MGRGLEWLGAVKGNRDEEARSEEPGRRRVRKREEKSVSTMRLYGTPSADPHSALPTLLHLASADTHTPSPPLGSSFGWIVGGLLQEEFQCSAYCSHCSSEFYEAHQSRLRWFFVLAALWVDLPWNRLAELLLERAVDSLCLLPI
nr:uncharacterized protein LOC109736510 isoform X2 [Aegilops tauschii subsp. strangulata]